MKRRNVRPTCSVLSALLVLAWAVLAELLWAGRLHAPIDPPDFITLLAIAVLETTEPAFLTLLWLNGEEAPGHVGQLELGTGALVLFLLWSCLLWLPTILYSLRVINLPRLALYQGVVLVSVALLSILAW